MLIMVIMAIMPFAVSSKPVPELFYMTPDYDVSSVLPERIGFNPQTLIPKDTGLESKSVFVPAGSVIVIGRDSVKVRFDSYMLSGRVMKRYNMHVESDTSKSNIIDTARASFKAYVDTVRAYETKNMTSYISISSKLATSSDNFLKGTAIGSAVTAAICVLLVLIPRL